MAEFSEAQQIAITEVLGITRDSLTSQLVYLGERVTQGVIDRIQEHLDSWDAGIGTNYVRVHPNLKNFGAEINPDLARDAIRSNIGNLLEFSSWGSGGGDHDTVYLERG
jgi:hypothetical protein